MDQNNHSEDGEQNPAPKKRRTVESSKLDLLPPEIKSDLHACIAKGYGSKRCRKYLVEMHGEKSALVNSSISAYEHYLKLYGVEISKSAEIEKNLLLAARHDFTDLKTVTTTTTPLSDKTKAFHALFDRAEARIRMLELAGDSGAFDPRREAMLGQYYKEQRAILESFHELQAAIQNEEPENLNKEFQAYSAMLIVCVKKAYEKIHGSNQASDFQSCLTTAITEGLDQWMIERGIANYRN